MRTLSTRTWLGAVLACASLAYGTETPKPAETSRIEVLTKRVAALEQARKEEGPALQDRAKNVQTELDRLEADIAKSGKKATDEQTQRRDALKAQLQAMRDKKQKQLGALEAAREELELLKLGERAGKRSAAFETAARDGTLKFTPEETRALRDRLADARRRLTLATSKLEELKAQNKTIESALAEAEPTGKVDAKKKADPKAKLDSQKKAELEEKHRELAEPLRMAQLRHRTLGEQVALLEKQYASAQKLAPVAPRAKKAPARAQEEVARRTEKADERLVKGREALQRAQQELERINGEIDGVRDRGKEPPAGLVRQQQKQELRVAIHESETAVAKIRKMELDAEKQRLRVVALLKEAEAALDRAKADAATLTLQERDKRQKDLSDTIAEAKGNADQLDTDTAAAQKRLGLYAEESSGLQARLGDLRRQPDKQRDRAHAGEMAALLDRAIQAVDEKIDKQKLYIYNLREQAYLHQQRAAVYADAQGALRPPSPSFWKRNQEIVDVVLIVLGIGVGLKILDFVFWIVCAGVVALARHAFHAARTRVKAYRTKIGFARSVAKTGLGIVGVVLVLKAFGVDPAKTAGAIGLIGLIMAGMFRELVMDFVKGFDIIAQGHFVVGDFIETGDGAGHVVDFNVKYTRIRKLSGQELCLPNSRCVPSKRFPGGYVDNYVDFYLTVDADVLAAGRIIDAACVDLNEQVEAVKEGPQRVAHFPGREGALPVLRYRVRVLPACPWVISECLVPTVKEALTRAEMALPVEPRSFYMNDIGTFRQLFNRELTEEEIIEKVQQGDPPEAVASAEEEGSSGLPDAEDTENPST